MQHTTRTIFNGTICCGNVLHVFIRPFKTMKHIVATNAMLRLKSLLKIVPCNITLKRSEASLFFLAPHLHALRLGREKHDA